MFQIKVVDHGKMLKMGMYYFPNHEKFMVAEEKEKNEKKSVVQ